MRLSVEYCKSNIRNMAAMRMLEIVSYILSIDTNRYLRNKVLRKVDK
jgi:hypothetical protein